MNATVLENEMAKLLSSEFIRETRSGTSALITALSLVGWSKDSEVIIPSVCCPAVLYAVNALNFKPVFVDMETDYFNMSIRSIQAAVTKNTVAIIFVHSFGITGEVEKAKEFCEDNNIFLIEDVCLAIGGRIGNKYLGTYGDASVFSFGYDKIISEKIGMAGAILLKNEGLYKNAISFLDRNLFFSQAGYNISSIKKQFKDLSKNVENRSNNAEVYFNKLDSCVVKKPKYRQRDVYWRYPVLYKKDRGKLLRKAETMGIKITTHYPSLNRFQSGSELLNADTFNASVLNFFVRPDVKIDYIDEVCDLVNSV